jgi:hypothetical protein
MGNSHSLCHSTKQSSRIHFAQHDGFSFLGLAHSLKTFPSCKMARCTQAFNSTELAPKTQQNPIKGYTTPGSRRWNYCSGFADAYVDLKCKKARD